MQLTDCPVPCARCRAPVSGLTAQEIREVLAAFGRAPLVLCAACEKRDAQEAAAAQAEHQQDALPPWSDHWPRRAILDLENFAGRPLHVARQMHAGLQRERGTYAILGDRGRGKTVMATWLAEQRRQRGQSPGIYVRSHDLFATVRRAWHPQSKEDEWAVLERYRKTPFLVIDEFQERSASAWENRTLLNILDHRHGDLLPTVLIANLSAEAFAASAGPSLMDRISQTGGLVECGWEGLRKAGR